MRITTQNQALFESILLEKKWVTSEELQELISSFPSTPLDELLMQKGILSKVQFRRVFDELEKRMKDQESIPTRKIFRKEEAKGGPSKDVEASSENQETRDLHHSGETVLLKPIKKATFGQYEVLEKLAEGGMGEVYKVRHRELKKIYALKILLLAKALGEDGVTRFQREAQMIARLKHPHIVQVIDSGQEDGVPYFVMEYVEGETLDEVKKELCARESLELLQKVLEALHYAHEQGIIHRDLKPSNIFVTPNKEPKIVDFGLAKDVTSTNQTLTQVGELLGTPAYMSPEQASGKLAHLDRTTDVYSMGVCLYELLTQQCPFQGNTLHHLIHKIIEEEALKPSNINADLHQDLDVIVLKSLEKSPRKRYETALAFAEDLKRFLKGYPILAKPPSFSEKCFKWMKRNRLFCTIIVLLLGFTIFFTGYIYWKDYEKAKIHKEARFSQFQHYLGRAEKYLDYDLQLDVDKTPEKQYRDRVTRSLRALTFLNQALELYPENEVALKKEFLLGESLIQLFCQSKEYEFARYIARELENNRFVQKDRKNLQDWIEQEQKKAVSEHLKRFEYWMKRLQSQEGRGSREDAVFEIIKMGEKVIFKRLLQFLEQGTEYFVKNKPITRDESKEYFYETIVLILGRLENPQATRFLSNSLQQMSQKMLAFPESQRSVTDTNYMVLLAQALAHLRSTEHIPEIYQLFHQMGENSLFFQKVAEDYGKFLVVREKLPQGKDFLEELLNRARVKLIKKDLEGSIEDFEEVLKQQPDHIYASKGLATALLKNNQLERSLEHYDQAMLLTPKDYEIYVNRGVIFIQQGKYEQAMENFNQAIELNPRSTMARHNRGLVKMNLGQLEEALEEFNQILQISPYHGMVYTNRANLWIKKQQFDKALLDVNQAIQLNPRLSPAYMARGNVYWHKKEFAKALEDYNQAIRFSQNSPQLADVYLNRSLVKEVMKDFEGALQDCKEALKIAPDSPKIFFSRGNLYMRMQQWEKALQDYNQLVQADPKNSHYYLIRGNCWEQGQKLEKALEDYERVIELAPQNVQGYLARANLKMLQKKWEEALEDFNYNIKLQPNNFYVYFSRANFYVLTEQLDKAIEDYNYALRLNPKAFDAYFFRGNIFYLKQQYEEALLDYQKALELNGNFRIIHLRLAQIFYEQKNFLKAFSATRHYLSFEPGNRVAFLLQGLIELELAREPQVLQSFLQEKEHIQYFRSYAQFYHVEPGRKTLEKHIFEFPFLLPLYSLFLWEQAQENIKKGKKQEAKQDLIQFFSYTSFAHPLHQKARESFIKLCKK